MQEETGQNATERVAPELPNRCLVDDDMKEVQYGPCGQCEATLSKPLRLFRHEQPTPRINCHQCHSGMGKSMQEMMMYGLGMPLITPPETLLPTAGQVPQPASGDTERG